MEQTGAYNRIEVTGDSTSITDRKIAWNGNYPYYPGTGGIKHYIYKTEFKNKFPDKATFKNKFPDREYSAVSFPGGYDE